MPKNKKAIDKDNSMKYVDDSSKVCNPKYFFKDYLNENGELIISKREGMSTDRSAMNSLAICHMIKKGFKLQDILNPDILIEERESAGREIYEKYNELSDEEFPSVMAEYMTTTLETVLKDINKEVSELPEITGSELVKPEHSHIFKSLFFLQDLGQELGRTNIKKAALELYGEEHIKKLFQAQSGGNYILDILSKTQAQKYNIMEGKAGYLTSEMIENDPEAQLGILRYVLPCFQAGYVEKTLNEYREKNGGFDIFGEFTTESKFANDILRISSTVLGGGEIQTELETFLSLDYVESLKKLGQAIDEGIFDGENILFDDKGEVQIHGFTEHLNKMKKELIIDQFIEGVSFTHVPDEYPKFRTEEYEMSYKSKNIPEDIQALGDVRELAEFYLNKKAVLTEEEKMFLIDRISNNIKLNDYEKRIKNGDIDIQPKIVKKENEYSFPTILLDSKQTADNGCWSCAMELLLKSRGIELNQREIREYRAGISKAQYQKTTNQTQLIKDEQTSLDENADTLINLIPNTGIFTREFQRFGDQNEVIPTVAATLKEAFIVHSSPVAINQGGHYFTVTGLDTTGPEEEWKVSYQDSGYYKGKNMTCTVKELCGVLTEQFTMSYLVEINENKDLSKIENKELVDRIQFDEENELVPKEGEQKPDKLLGACTSGFYFSHYRDTDGANGITESLYMPKSINPDLPSKYKEKTVSKIDKERNKQYLNEFKRLAKDIIKTDSSFSRDSESYKAFHKTVMNSLDKLTKVEHARFQDVFSDCIKKVCFSSAKYKSAHMKLNELSDRQTRRIKAMNRLENLQRRWNRGEKKPLENLDYMLGEKYTEGYLINKVKGKEAKKYIPLFLNSKAVEESAIKLAKDHPFEKVHGAQLDDDTKSKFIFKPCSKVFENARALLKMDQNEYNELLEEVDGIINFEANKPEPEVRVNDVNELKKEPIIKNELPTKL